MHIDLNVGGISTPLSKAAAEKLSQQMAAILLELRVPPNKSIGAVVENVSNISSAERAALIVQHKQTTRNASLIELLRNPATKLVELKLHQKTFHVMTDIPLLKAQKLIITPSQQHFLTKAESITAATPSAVRTPIETHAQTKNPEIAQRTLTNLVGNIEAPIKPQSSSPPQREQPLASAEANPLRASNLKWNHVEPVVKSALARDLPVAQTVSQNPLLSHLLSSGPSSGQPVTGTGPALNSIQQLQTIPLTLSAGTTLTTKQVADKILNSGVFYESRLHQALLEHGFKGDMSGIRDHDAKSILLQAQADLSSLLTTTQGATAKQAPMESITKLLSQLFGPKPTPSGGQSAPQSSSTAPHQLMRAVDGALAQIQLRQTHALIKQFSEPPSAQTTVSFDIPLRFPDGIFNMLVTMFEPERREKKNKRKQEEQRRQWKMRLNLDLGSSGELTSEVTAEENQIEAVFWANNAELRDATRGNLESLQKELTERGITVSRIHCSDEQPPPREEYRIDSPLIDLET